MNSKENTHLYELLSRSSYDIGQDCGHPIPPEYRLVRCDGRIVRSVPGFELALLNDTGKEVVYYNSVIVINNLDLNLKPATQSLVWRSPKAKHESVTHKLAGNVFSNYILPRYIAIVSDGNQTAGGKFFWERQVSSALDDNKHVYFYKIMHGSLEPIKNEQDFDILKNHIWGDKPANETNLVVISSEPLPLDKSYKLPVHVIQEMEKIDKANVEEPDLISGGPG